MMEIPLAQAQRVLGVQQVVVTEIFIAISVLALPAFP